MTVGRWSLPPLSRLLSATVPDSLEHAEEVAAEDAVELDGREAAPLERPAEVLEVEEPADPLRVDPRRARIPARVVAVVVVILFGLLGEVEADPYVLRADE